MTTRDNQWLAHRRMTLNLKQDDLVARLKDHVYEVSRITISNWETGKSNPPLHDPNFRVALSRALELNIHQLLLLAGYEVESFPYTSEGLELAWIFDTLPYQEGRYLLVLAREMARMNEIEYIGGSALNSDYDPTIDQESRPQINLPASPAEYNPDADDSPHPF